MHKQGNAQRSLRIKNGSLNNMCQYLLVVLFVLLFQLHNLFQHFVYNNIYTTCLTHPFKSQVVSFLISSAHYMGSFIIVIIIIIYTIKVICKLNWQFEEKKKKSSAYTRNTEIFLQQGVFRKAGNYSLFR